MGISVLWRQPEVNPLNHKAYSVPILNPFNKYGRIFLFSTLGFHLAFMSWYAFPPLAKTIQADLHLTPDQVQNGNIVALVATLLIRTISGPLCDRFGPRYTFIGLLLAGAIPTALVGLVKSSTGLIVVRFFVGILGGTFVPCQVWSTQWFDRRVVGTANGLMAGIGNGGGGVTYFVMPAIFDSLVQKRHLTKHVAWRVAFIVPFILIGTMAICMLLFCDDTPTGPWKTRQQRIHELTEAAAQKTPQVVDAPKMGIASGLTNNTGSPAPSNTTIDEKKIHANETVAAAKTRPDEDLAIEHLQSEEIADVGVVIESEVVRDPTLKEAFRVIFSPQCAMLALPYACAFGSELSINSNLGLYYMKNFPDLSQTTSGRWAAIFGFSNVVFRPLGGLLGDTIYRTTQNSRFISPVHAKKAWLISLGTMQGVICLLIGLLDSHHKAVMFSLVTILAMFMDGGNGANFALVPHVHPHANGIISGIVGATGNLGGVIFALLFRFNGTNYQKVIWILGVITVTVNLGVSWIRPIPKGQIGGR